MGKGLCVDEVRHKFLKVGPGDFIAIEVVDLMSSKLLAGLV